MYLDKNKKSLVIAIIFGVICAVCIFIYTQSIKLEADEARNSALARYGGEQLEVCVAKRDIAAGSTIDSSCYEVKLWVADLLPDEAVRNSSEILGKQVTSSIVSGEVITNKRFQDSAVSLEIPKGLTAVSVPAKDVSAVGGALSSGMHVNIYSTGNTTTSLIGKNILVLATSTSFSESSSKSSFSWVTLAVSPSEVEELVSASQTSSLYFVVPSDEEQDKSEDDYKQDNFKTNSDSNKSFYMED